MAKKNEIMLQGFEWYLPSDGKHWNRIALKAPSFKWRGITSVWLPPATKGMKKENDAGYAVYDLYDLGEFDQQGRVRTKYGTVKEYTFAISVLHLLGIRTLSDMVMNHRLSGDETEKVKTHRVNPQNRLEVSPEVQEEVLYTKFTYPGRKGMYSDFKWDSTCFTAVDYSADVPVGQSLFLIDGKSFAPDVDSELGNFDYLLGCDVDVRMPKVKEELIRWGKFYVNKTNVDGFRLDAVKHMSAAFIRDWLAAVRKETHKPLFTVGEYWSGNLDSLLNYIYQTNGSLSLFDVPLHYHFHTISSGDGRADMRSILTGTLSTACPDLTVSFVDNHDTQPDQCLQSFVDGWFKPAAYGIILLRGQGIPCVFWGDLYGMPYKKIQPVEDLPLLMKVCKKFAYGDLCDYFDDPSIVGFTRTGSRDMPGSGLAFLCSNNGDGKKRMSVGRHFAGKTFICRHGKFPPVVIDNEGYGVFRVSHCDYSLYVPASFFENLLYKICSAVKNLFHSFINLFSKSP